MKDINQINKSGLKYLRYDQICVIIVIQILIFRENYSKLGKK